MKSYYILLKYPMKSHLNPKTPIRKKNIEKCDDHDFSWFSNVCSITVQPSISLQHCNHPKTTGIGSLHRGHCGQRPSPGGTRSPTGDHLVAWLRKGGGRWLSRFGYGSIPIDTFLVGWTSIYQLFWGSLGTRVLTHPHFSSQNYPWEFGDWWLKVSCLMFEDDDPLIWVNYNDLTTTSLDSWLVREIIPKWP